MASNATDGTVRAQHWWRIFRRQNVPLPCSIKVSSKRRRWPKCFTRQRPAMNAPGVMGKSTTHGQTSHVIGRPPNWPLHVENPPNEPFMDAGGHWDGPMNACARVAQSRSGPTSHFELRSNEAPPSVRPPSRLLQSGRRAGSTPCESD